MTVRALHVNLWIGFITPDDRGDELVLRCSAWAGNDEDLKPGPEVGFDLVPSKKGEPRSSACMQSTDLMVLTFLMSC